MILFECRHCHLVDVTPTHNCPVEAEIIHSSKVIRICEVCGEQLPAGKAFHTQWCAQAHREELDEQRQQVIARCRIGADDISGYIDGALDLADWQKQILHQLVEEHRSGRKVRISSNSRRAGKQTLKRHWERIEKLLNRKEPD